MLRTPLTVRQIDSMAAVEPYLAGLRQIVTFFRKELSDDFSGDHPDTLLENTLSCIPFLWLITDEAGNVYASSALSDIVPGRHGFIHGMRLPVVRRHPGVKVLIGMMLRTAFETLGLRKLKAEFDADNRSALGFCLCMGFRREARFPADTVKRGMPCDVLLYALTAEQYNTLYTERN